LAIQAGDRGEQRNERGERQRGPTQISFSRRWFVVAATSVVLLAAAAPSGLYLLGFLGVIIVTHEAGHLVVARLTGMRPTEFFWGFGPEIFSIQVGHCRYGLKAVFLGGYVKIEGMTPTSEVPDGFPESGTYRAASHWRRLATILAGPAVNIGTALMAFGLVELRRGVGVGQSVATAWHLVGLVISSTAASLGRLFTNLGTYVAAVLDPSGATEAPVRFLSPVGQADVSGQAVELGLGASLQWFGILACAVGAINLVPLPPLDGAHALVAVAEGLVQRIKRDRSVTFNVARFVPVAYVTLGLLLALSTTALILDLRDLAS
jgi:membrane-associated protease RseP (regulator of RpoE activity)